ncbi:hypothetical protein BIY29_14645 [Brenneria alni]|uniref:Uncharacterized protein n=1 Tax=Brenneria alni TaxID=71656 RepID=A0A421DL43_9GAMM|nr:hypothetical protein [Brenneria alni]RLM20819.1 hypothetical protein BIY29_14645 [Brenneria alni]
MNLNNVSSGVLAHEASLTPAIRNATEGELGQTMSQQRLESRITPRLQQAMKGHDAHFRQNERREGFNKEKPIEHNTGQQRLEHLDLPQAISHIRDTLRYEIIMPLEVFMKQLRAILKTLRDDGLQIIRLWNGYQVPHTLYAGINVKMRDPEVPEGEGNFELQFRTPQSLRTRLEMQDSDERLRELPVETPEGNEQDVGTASMEEPEQRAEPLREAAARVPHPEDIDTLPSFSREPG